ncbi:hypothetical protein WDU94_003202 [Cyamophila willieti]
MLPGIGLFGTGNLVGVIVPFLREKGFKIEAIWSRTLSEAERASKELNIPFFTNKIDDVLLRKDVDLIFIMCSPNLHAQIAVKALGIGKHVVCDKPAGLCQQEALKMVRASQYYPALISILNHSLRFLPAFIHMKKSLQDSYVGSKIHVMDVRVHMGSLIHQQYDWLCDSTMGGGVITLVGSHVIDLITYLTGERAIRVHSVVKTFNPNTSAISGIRNITSPDYCVFQLELTGGALVTVTLNTHLAQSTFSQEILICGPSGYLVVRNGDLYGFKNGCGKEDVLYLDVEDMNFNSDVIPKPYIKGLFKMISALKESFLNIEENKSGWIKQPVSVASTFEDGLYIQGVIEAIQRSNLNREWTKVSIITQEPDPNPLLSAAVRRSGITMS